MNIYDFAIHIRNKLNAEADKLAMRNGRGGSKDHDQYQLMCGRIKGLEEAAKIISDAVSDAHEGKLDNKMEENNDEDS